MIKTKQPQKQQPLKIKWNEDGKPSRIFNLDMSQTWKGKMVMGYDVAEMICDHVFAKEKVTLQRINIISPPEYQGSYEVNVEYDPLFTAKKVA